MTGRKALIAPVILLILAYGYEILAISIAAGPVIALTGGTWIALATFYLIAVQHNRTRDPVLRSYGDSVSPWGRIRPREPFTVDGITYNRLVATNYVTPMIELRAEEADALWTSAAIMLLSEPELSEDQFRTWVESGRECDLHPHSRR